MIVYLDASALVKRYVAEAGSADVGRLLARAEAVGTATVSRAEVAAALARAYRTNVLQHDEARSALQVFTAEWDDIIRIQLTEGVVSRAAALAWDHALRGYDAIHLAAALSWQDLLGETVTVATYDRQLWEAVRRSALVAWPTRLR
ncbi:MAG: type II toxin-antitoxin system VapC family toxin [Armatimonadota bacterium]|nr:type II toxin-antitoxin system VapC family toxin [Armatimonadota bacterium]